MNGNSKLYNTITLLIKSGHRFIDSDPSKLLQSLQNNFPLKLQPPSLLKLFPHTDKTVSKAKVDFSVPLFSEVCMKSLLALVFCAPCCFQTARKYLQPFPLPRPFLPGMARATFLQAKLKLGAFPVIQSWLLGVLHNLCLVGSGFCGHGCRAKEFVRQGYCSSQNNKKEEATQHSVETSFGHTGLCSMCSELPKVLVWHR